MKNKLPRLPSMNVTELVCMVPLETVGSQSLLTAVCGPFSPVSQLSANHFSFMKRKEVRYNSEATKVLKHLPFLTL